jgi:transcriptional regulator with XRE-family HTH domain
MDSNKIGNYITKLRKENNLTQEQLAERIGVSSKTVSKWENGINIPDTYYFYELSKLFDVTIQDLINGEKIYNALDNNSMFLKSITFYNNIFKKKATRFTVGTILIVLLLFSILYTFNNYNQNKIYDLSSANKDYTLNGYIISNPKESIVFINNFNYLGENVGTEFEPVFNNYKIEVFDENNKSDIYNDEDSLNENISLSKFLHNLNISFTINKNDSKILKTKSFENVYLQLIYCDNKNNAHSIIIDLETKEHFSSNKILY